VSISKRSVSCIPALKCKYVVCHAILVYTKKLHIFNNISISFIYERRDPIKWFKHVPDSLHGEFGELFAIYGLADLLHKGVVFLLQSRRNELHYLCILWIPPFAPLLETFFNTSSPAIGAIKEKGRVLTWHDLLPS